MSNPILPPNAPPFGATTVPGQAGTIPLGPNGQPVVQVTLSDPTGPNSTLTATPVTATTDPTTGATNVTDVDETSLLPTDTTTTATTTPANVVYATPSTGTSWLTYGAIGLVLVGAYLLWRHLDNKI